MVRRLDRGYFEPEDEYENDLFPKKRARTTRERVNTLLLFGGLLVAVAVIGGLFLLLSKGSGGPKVPDVIGKSYREAREKIESAGFDVEIDRNQDYSNTGELDKKKVKDQDPKAGAPAEKGELVTVRLKGLKDIPMASGETGTEGPGKQPGDSATDSRQNQSAAQQSPATTSAGGRSVCIDPGHSGPGATSEIDPATGLDVADNGGAPGEIQTNWELGQKVTARLEAAGYTVRLTKDSQNANVNLRTRADIGNTCSIVVRLHYDPDLHAVLFPGEGQYKQHGDKIVYVEPAVARGSAELASALLPFLNTAGVTRKMNDMGGTSNNTGPAFVGSVLSRVPVVLIENAPEMVRNNPSGQDEVAGAIVGGINEYFKNH